MPKPNPDDLAVAWKVYENLLELADLLWETYERPFLENVEQEMCEPPPTHEPEDIDDDIPF